MPAVTVEDLVVLPRLVCGGGRSRPVTSVQRAQRAVEGAGFVVWRAFPGAVDARATDPFFLLDQLGPVDYAPHEAVGAPWHPHRGFETVTYVLDGVIEHHDSHGGGGVIAEGDTQWMTAGSGILHDEVPSAAFRRAGGRSHGVQLWVNLPAASKFLTPNYQAIGAGELVLLTSADAGALIRLIAGSLGGHQGPGTTHTPITYAHVSVEPGARLELPWDRAHNAMVYALSGRGMVGPERVALDAHCLALFGPGDSVLIEAGELQPEDSRALEVLVLGGLPIREPIVHYGPFLMNTRAQILEAIEDYNAGRMGVIPATERTR